MKKNFTQLIAKSSSLKRYSVAVTTLLLLMVSAVYLRAAVGITVTGGSAITISADLAANATLSTPGYTAIGNISLVENLENDISSTGNLILTAPTGWRFNTAGVTATAGPATGENRGNVRIAVGVPTVSADGITITIPITNHSNDRFERITVSGMQIQALNGANLPATGNVRLSAASGATISGLPTTAPQTISQINGAPRKIAFGQQPTNTLTGNAILPAPNVVIQDQFNNTVTNGEGNNTSVTIAIGNNPAGSDGVLGGTNTIAAVNGVATFAGLSIDAAGTGYTLAATTTSLGGATSNAFNVSSKVPTLNAPTACITEGAANTTITLIGTNFERKSVGRVNGSDRTTTFVSSTELQVALLASDLASAGNISLSVLNLGPPTDNVSNTQPLAINPVLTSVSIVGERIVCAGNDVLYTAPEGYTEYNWTSSEGSSVLVPTNNPAVVRYAPTVPASGKVTISVSAKNACGVSSSASIEVDVKPTPQAIIERDKDSFCAGGNLELRAFVNPANLDSYFYRWFKQRTDGGYDVVGSDQPTYTVTAAGTYRLTVTGANGCANTSDPVAISVDPLPSVSITGLNAAYCSSDAAVTLVGSPTGGSFRILKNSVEVATGASFDPVALGAGDYVVEYTYTDGNTCTNTTTQAVTVKQQPTITVTNDLAICLGNSATLTAGGADTYTWSPATGLSATSGASVTANPTQTTTYTVIGTTNGCQSESKTVTVTVKPLPDATVRPTGPTGFCVGNSVVLVAKDDPSYTYQWFRNGTLISGAVGSSHEVTQVGTNSFYVRITKDGCPVNSDEVSVTVSERPNSAAITIVGSTTFCDGGSVKLQAPDGTNYEYLWEAKQPDGTFSSAPVEAGESNTIKDYIARSTGIYRVVVTKVTIDPDTGAEIRCDKTSDEVSVTELPQPTAQILGGNQTICEDADGITSFFLDGEYSGGTHTWSSNKNAFVIAEVTDPETGKSRIRVDVAANAGASSATITLRTLNSTSACNLAVSSVDLSIKPIPETIITANRSTTLCRGESVVLTANPATGNYLWSTGATTRSITVSDAGSYTVKVTNSNGCDITSAPTTVIVNELPLVKIETPLANTYCKSEAAVPLTGSPAGGSFRILNTSGTAVVANATQFDPGALAAGTYTIEYSFTDGNTCTNTATKTVTINALPTVTIVEPSKAAYCTSEPVFNLASNQNGGSFTINGQSATAFNAAALGAGTHSIVYTYTDANGCTNTATKSVTVNPLPTASIDYTGPTTFCQGGSLVLTGVSNTGTSFTWFRNGAQVGTGPTYSANQSGSYTVRATNGNTCTSEMSTAVAVSVTTPITGNTIAGDQTVCSGAPIAPLGQASGTTLSGGTAQNTYQWEEKIGTGAWNTIPGATNASYTPPARTVGSTTVYSYQRKVSGGGCSSTSGSVSVTINPNPTINGFSLGSDNDSDGDGKFADVYTGQASLALTGSPTGGFFRINGGTTNVTSFNPCTLGPGTHTITYTRTSGSCTTVVSKTVRVIQSTYRAVITANPHPFCRGVQVTYTTTIYRDLEPGDVIYPYLVDANGQPIYSNGNSVPTGSSSFPEPNMAYPFPANTPQVVKDLAYRFFQPLVKDGLESKIVSRDAATYQWGKNHEVDRKNDLYYTTDAGLSSQDYYHVYANLSQCGTVIPLQSNRMYSAELPGYSATLTVAPNPICSSGTVTLTAELNTAFDWATANTTVEFVLARGDVPLGPPQPFIDGVYKYTLNTAGPAGGFVNGDQVYLRFNTDIEKNQTIRKCADNNRSNNVTINVVVPQAFTGGGTFCEGSAGVPIGLSSSQSGVSYQLLRNGAPVGSPVAGTGGAISFGNQTVPGAYSISPTTASGSTCTTFGTMNLYETKLPLIATVSGGGEYCAGGAGVPIKVANSQTGVSYQLRRTVGSSTSNVGSPINGNGGEITFPLQTEAGTYTVRATTISGTNIASCPRDMSGSALVTINPLPTVTVNNPTTCETTPVLVTANVSSGTGPYTYNWKVPTGWTGDAPKTASFETTVPGTYTVTVTDDKSCSSVSATSNVTVTPLDRSFEGPLLEVMWNEAQTQWTVKAIEDTDYPEVDFGPSPTFRWYKRIFPTTSWGEPLRDDSGNLYSTDTYVENNPVSGLEFKVEVVNAASCVLYNLTNIGIKPLPVEIIYLTAQKQGTNVMLEWATAMERDNTGFEIQVSEDGQNYRKLDFVATKNGNTSLKQVYQYLDKENGKYGTRYYRLKQMDHSGQVEYFGPKVVEFGSVTNKIVVYPNPFVNKIEMNIDAEQDGEMEIILSNSVGKQLIHKTILVEKGVNSEQLILESNLPQGVYFVTTRMGSVTNHFKLLKQ